MLLTDKYDEGGERTTEFEEPSTYLSVTPAEWCSEEKHLFRTGSRGNGKNRDSEYSQIFC